MSPRKQKSIKKEPGTEEESTKKSEVKKETAKEAILTKHEIVGVSSGDCPDDADGATIWDLTNFKKRFQLKLINYDRENDCLEFDMIGIHPSIANAFRRIILSEVPSMAIERVRMMNNTSILQDEFLAHRLGLIPIRADPSQFSYKKASSEYDNKDQPTDDDPKDTLLFSLRVKRSPDSSSGKTPLSPKKRTASTSSKTTGGEGDEIHPMIEVGKDGKVLSSYIKWIPLPGQLEKFSADPPRSVHPDILIARLNPRQEIDCTLEVVKGEGGDHTKFSPVATASYRLLPKVEILNEITGEAAERLKSSFSPGVIEIDKKGRAIVVDSRKDHLARNHLRHEDLKDIVRTSLVKDHFIFTVESTGARPAHEIVKDSFDILIGKCNKFLRDVENLKGS